MALQIKMADLLSAGTPSKPSSSISPFPPPIPNPPPPEPPPSGLTSASTPPPIRWTALFAAKPWNAGKFSPPSFQLKFNGQLMVPSEEIVAAGEEVWNNYLVGFFLDKPLCYTVVINRLKQIWKPKGSIKVKSNGKVFFFLLSDEDDRKRISEGDPLFIRGKIFIIQPWTATCNPSANSINKVPVWIKITEVPLFAWSLSGICWLASRIGKCLCLDYSTERLERLEYAKCMVELTPESEMPSDFLVQHPDGSEYCVKIEYFWTPEVCSQCKVFGHKLSNCQINKVSTPAVQTVVEKKRIENVSNSHNSNIPKKTSGASNVSRMIDKSLRTSWTTVNSKGSQRPQVEVSGAVQNVNGQSASKSKDGGSVNLNLNNMFGVLNQINDNVRRSGGENDDCELVNYATNDTNARGKATACDTNIKAKQNCAQMDDTNTMKNLLEEVMNYDNNSVTERRKACADKNAASFERPACVAVNDISQQDHNAAEGTSKEILNEPSATGSLDNFLMQNFNVESSYAGRSRQRNPANKSKDNFFSNETVPEQIEKLRNELDSGKVCGDLYVQKKYIMELMQNNYNTDMNIKDVSDKDKGKQKASSNPGSTMPKLSKPLSPLPFKPGFLNSQSPKSDSAFVQKSNIYALIAPPSAFKAPPGPLAVLETQADAIINEETVKTPLTRSRMRELSKMHQDKG